METQDYSSDLMDYLYGEMTIAQKKEFEAKMASDEKLRKEYQELKEVREGLAMLDDKQVMEPFGIWRSAPSGWMGSRRSRSRIILRPLATIAAAFVILMVVGYLTDFTIRLNSEGLQLGFGNIESSTALPGLSVEDVKMILAQEIEKSKTDFNKQLAANQENIDVRLSNLEKGVENPVKSNKDVISKEELSRFLASVEQQNAELLQQYLHQTTLQQQEYFKTMLTQFNDYLQEQRLEDLNLLQAGLMEIQYNQTQQKIETEMALANLFATVSNR
jgi:LEA14-like dessication related protein